MGAAPDKGDGAGQHTGQRDTAQKELGAESSSEVDQQTDRNDSRTGQRRLPRCALELLSTLPRDEDRDLARTAPYVQNSAIPKPTMAAASRFNWVLPRPHGAKRRSAAAQQQGRSVLRTAKLAKHAFSIL